MAAPNPKPIPFRWPPGPPPPAPQRAIDEGQERAPDAGLGPRLAGWWSRIEEAWLGRTLAPLAERARAERWSPDTPDRYCPRCGRGVELLDAVVHEGPAFGCPLCREAEVPWSRIIRLGPHEGLLRGSIHVLKFSPLWREGVTLGGWLGGAISRALAEAGVPAGGACLVPIPTTFRRRVRRGIDHTDALVRGAGRASGLPIVRALARRHGPSQVQVPASQRRRNVRGTMRLKSGLPGLVVLVDDVVTTGATMGEACRAIVQGCRRWGCAPPVLWVATCAVAGHGGRGPGPSGGGKTGGKCGIQKNTKEG